MRRAVANVRLSALLSVLACLGSVACLTWVSQASAATCTNDIDCPTATCGGEVCQWSASGHACVAAGTAPQGTDGWCGADTDCKCMGEGATCVSPHCTFTLPRDAAAGDSSAGSSSSSGGNGYSSSGGSNGYSSGGGSSSGGPVASPPTNPDASTTSGTSTPGSSGGCSVCATGEKEGPWRVVLGLGVATLFASRRKRSG
jgi:MYXO-CTERM domain-containing protein